MISKRMQFQNPIEKSQLKLTTATVRPEPDQLENTLKAPLHSSDANLHQVRSEEDGRRCPSHDQHCYRHEDA